jgi:hypothetical protein
LSPGGTPDSCGSRAVERFFPGVSQPHLPGVLLPGCYERHLKVFLIAHAEKKYSSFVRLPIVNVHTSEHHRFMNSEHEHLKIRTATSTRFTVPIHRSPDRVFDAVESQEAINFPASSSLYLGMESTGGRGWEPNLIGNNWMETADARAMEDLFNARTCFSCYGINE